MNDNSNESADSRRPVIMWFRDDLRLSDSPALDYAADKNAPLVLIYLLDEVSEGCRPLGGAAKWFLHHGLRSLQNDIGDAGAKLILRKGAAAEQIPTIARQLNAELVVWNRRFGNAGSSTDSAVSTKLRELDIACQSFNGNLLHDPEQLKTGDGGFYKVYSPFWRAFTQQSEPRDPISAPSRLNGLSEAVHTLALDDLELLPRNPDWSGGLQESWVPGESGARDVLDAFLEDGLSGYAKGRDRPDLDHVSKISPFLRWGMISPYQVWHSVGKSEATENDRIKFRKELGWREFSYHLLHHFPDISKRNFNEKFDDFPWRSDSEALKAWQKGKTGYPIVDAGMRQLWHTGYMHNRVRMVVASFLSKHLLIDWREGEKWFWDTLVDADPANNPASWQWVAGSGADAAPYFRVFNPILQGRKFDPDGAYVGKWVPEIGALDEKNVHAPFDIAQKTLDAADFKLGETYPEPLVEHSHARQRALDAFDSIKKAA